MRTLGSCNAKTDKVFNLRSISNLLQEVHIGPSNENYVLVLTTCKRRNYTNKHFYSTYYDRLFYD